MNQIRNRLPQFTKNADFCQTKYNRLLIGSFSCSVGYIYTRRNVTTLTAKTRLTPQVNAAKENGFSWSKLWKYLKKNWFSLCVGVGCAMLAAFFNVQIPISLGEITGVLAEIIKTERRMNINEYWNLIKDPALKFCAMVGAQSLSSALTIAAIANVGESMSSEMKKDLFRSLQSQDLTFFEMHTSGDLIKRINDDIQEFKSDFKKLVSQGIKSSSQTIGVVAVLYKISPQLTISLGAGVASLVGIGTVIGRALRKRSKDNHAKVAEAQRYSAETINNQRTVRSFSNEDLHIQKYSELVSSSEKSSKELAYGIATFQGLTNAALNSIVGGTVLAGGLLLGGGHLNSSDLMSFLGATQMLQKSLATLSQMMTVYIKMTISGDRVFEHISLAQGETVQSGTKIPRWKMLGDVIFHNVGFTYSTRDTPVLGDFNLRLQRNQTAALVGTSGNGKSTIAALLARLYDPNEGSIYLDGVNLKNLDAKWLRNEMIGYIGQEPVLFSGSIMDNIRYGNPNATFDDVIDAAKRANAHDFILSFPDGYDSRVGERGAALSGGQKQRIAIARAIIKNPQILILDEATSALDTESERVVQDALEANFDDRTVLIIAHRLSTIEKARIIHVIENGKIIESGSHEDLNKKKGAYFNLQKK